MRSRRYWLTLMLAAIGLMMCVLGVSVFLWSVFSNNLPWTPNMSPREYYLEVGNAFGNGFIMGFFLCFFLVLGVLTIGTMLGFIRDHRSREGEKTGERRLRMIRFPAER